LPKSECVDVPGIIAEEPFNRVDSREVIRRKQSSSQFADAKPVNEKIKEDSFSKDNREF
jgi:hypothetical protein